MEVMKKKAVPGHAYRVRRSFRYQLPTGLADGTILTVVSSAAGAIRMRDTAQREWLVPTLCVETGHLYKVDDCWLEASDPRVEWQLVAKRSLAGSA